MSAFRILVAEDHPVFRFGLCSLLRSHEGWEVCGEASDGPHAVERYKELKPDLLILDICLPRLNGVDVARRILKHSPSRRILILTDVNSEQVIRDCLEAGVRGWIFKSDGTDDLITAIEALQLQRSAFSARVSELVLDGYLNRRHIDPAATKVPKLTSREREVVQLLGEGNSSKDIAIMLNISVKTTETHRSNIMFKLKIHSIAELVLYAVRNELVRVKVPEVLRFPVPAKDRSSYASRPAVRGSMNFQ